MQALNFETRAVNGGHVVTIHGRLDAPVAHELKQKLDSLIRGGEIHLVVDLAGVEFVDSTGLSVLITALKSASGLGGEVVLLRPTSTVRSIIELTRLHLVFRVYDDEATALRTLPSTVPVS